MICTFNESCKRESIARTLCPFHYKLEKKYNNLAKYAYLRRRMGTGTINKGGYKRITTPDGRRIFEHRFVVEKILKRKLQRGEVVHHIDENKLNNSLSNLELTTQSRHVEIHRQRLIDSRHTDGLKVLDWSNFKKPEFRKGYHKLKSCSVEFCGKDAVSWGLCRRHATSYHKWSRHH